MVPLIVPIILLLVLVLIVTPLWTITRIYSLTAKNEALERRLNDLKNELFRLREETGANRIAVSPLPVASAVPPEPVTPIAVAPEPVAVAAVAPATPPPLPPVEVTPVVAREVIEPPSPSPVRAAAAKIDWEQFMGAKLFAWLGGLAAFLGVAFFVKYSFEHGWISPELRATFGFVFGSALVAVGLKINGRRYAVTAQTLIATGIVSLYAVTFACNAIYKFDAFEDHPVLPFSLMSLITVAAFLLAVRLEAQVIAILGVLGGLLTPELLSTGRDNPWGLFGYIGLLDAGLIAITRQRRWLYLILLGAAGTVMIQLGWAQKFLNPEKATTAMVVCLAFCGLFLAGYFFVRRRPVEAASPELDHPSYSTWAAIAFPFVAFGFAAVFFGYGTIAARPGLLFAFVFAADACLLALAWYDEWLPKLHLVAGLAVFGLLATWTALRLTEPLLPWALGLYLVYAIGHTVFPLLLERRRPHAAPTWWSQLYPPLSLLLMLGPLFKLDAVSLVLWPAVLLIDLCAIGVALFTASLAGVAAVLILTLVATGLWLLRVPAAADITSPLLLVVGGFALLFFGAGLFLVRQLGERLPAGTDKSASIFGDARAQLPAFSTLLPFALLIMMTARLPLASPAPLFGLALLLVGLSLGLAFAFTIEWLPLCPLIGVAALEYAWQSTHSRPPAATTTLGWFISFYAIFSAYPFVLRKRFAGLTGPWAAAALAGVVQFPLVHQLIQRTWPNDFMGLVPALFALAPLASFLAILRTRPADARARLNQLAWFGGVTLWFITLIFPIQFERQWITLGWALEGVALLWLFHRVPHPALRATGASLLVIAFVRLALNPAVLHYQVRSGTPIVNWYLYSYGIVIAALFTGAKLLAGPRKHTLGLNAHALLNTLGAVLAFYLLNIEIADYFTPLTAPRLVFNFSGNFARDMSYTVAWALFALAMLLVSFWKKTRLGRYGGQALLVVAMAKLFLHDLARLEKLYRIGAFFAVAVIAILASAAYQRFQPTEEKPNPEKP